MQSREILKLDFIHAAGLYTALTKNKDLAVSPKDKITPALREYIQNHKAELLRELERQQKILLSMKPVTSSSHDTADKAYQTHHWGCRHCIAGGQGRGVRCMIGKELWAQYLQTLH